MGHAWDARHVWANSRSSERGQTCPPTTLNTWWQSPRGLVARWSRVDRVRPVQHRPPASYSRSACRKFRIYAASWRPTVRSTAVWPRQYWIQLAACAQGHRATAPEKSSGAAQVNAVDINYGEDWTSSWVESGGCTDGRRRDNRPLIVLSVLTSWRHLIAETSTSLFMNVS